MPISLDPELETKLRARAQSAGLTIEAYLERIAREEQSAEEELEVLALEGLNSGDPIEPGPGFWEERHRRVDQRLQNS